MYANLLRPTERGEWGLCEDTLFIISWIETSLLSANLSHNSNMKMDSCFRRASKAGANNRQSINQIWAHQCNTLLILFLFPSRPLIHLSPTSPVFSCSLPPIPPHQVPISGWRGRLRSRDRMETCIIWSLNHTILAAPYAEWNGSINWMQQKSSEL